MLLLATPLVDYNIDVINRALDELPTYEESEQWMISNRFIGSNEIKEPCIPGRSINNYYHEVLLCYYPKSSLKINILEV